MLFDWFTIVAQIANFLILMWLLKRFLYKPILTAIDQREHRISKLVSETEQSQKTMQQQQDELKAKNMAFSKERERLLTQAKKDADQLKKKLEKTASEEVAQLRNKWLSALQKEQDKLDHDISLRTHKAVFDLARKTLKDLSGEELEAQIIQVFIKRLAQLSEDQRLQFSNSSEGNILIRSASSLSDETKQALQQSIALTFSTPLSIQFEQDPSLISGIEMIGSGHKLSWHVDDYLSKLEESIAQRVSNAVGRYLPPKDKGEVRGVTKQTSQ